MQFSLAESYVTSALCVSPPANSHLMFPSLLVTEANNSQDAHPLTWYCPQKGKGNLSDAL